MTQGSSYILNNIRKLLMRLDDPQIQAILIDHFPEVKDRITSGMVKDEIINLLFSHCQHTPEKHFEELLLILKEQYPELYDHFLPYKKEFIKDKHQHSNNSLNAHLSEALKLFQEVVEFEREINLTYQVTPDRVLTLQNIVILGKKIHVFLEKHQGYPDKTTIWNNANQVIKHSESTKRNIAKTMLENTEALSSDSYSETLELLQGTLEALMISLHQLTLMLYDS